MPYIMRNSCRSRFLFLYLQDVAAVPSAVAHRWPLDCHQSAGLFIYGKTYHIHMHESNESVRIKSYIYSRCAYRFAIYVGLI